MLGRLIVIFSFVLGAACSRQIGRYVGGPHYFASWSGYDLPRHPVKPLSAADAKRRVSYYEAYFDAEGRLVQFSKYLNGRLDWSETYTYHNGVFKDRILKRADGSEDRSPS